MLKYKQEYKCKSYPWEEVEGLYRHHYEKVDGFEKSSLYSSYLRYHLDKPKKKPNQKISFLGWQVVELHSGKKKKTD